MNKIAAVLLLLAGSAIGAAVMGTGRSATKPPDHTFYIYYSDLRGGERTISIEANGKTEIGAKYDRTTEARKLFEAVRQMQNGGATADCHETGYYSPYWTSPRDGMAQVFTGPANPPPPRLIWSE